MVEQKSSGSISTAICVVPEQDVAPVVVPQPRPPTSLQGLMKFALEATKREDAPADTVGFQPLSAERRRFLEQAMQSLTIDVVEVLLKQIEILKALPDKNTADDIEDAPKYLQALETVCEFVCDMDTANDFYKIGGFVILKPCLQCSNAEIRAAGGNLLAELTQNNPICQNVILENNFLPLLLEMVECDCDATVLVKVLYAISCIVRDNLNGVNQLIQFGGVGTLLECLKNCMNEKCHIKICFLMLALCNFYPDFKSRLTFSGYIPVLCGLVSRPHNAAHEHVLALLLRLIENEHTALIECDQIGNFEQQLENYMESIKNREDCSTELLLCAKLDSALSQTSF